MKKTVLFLFLLIFLSLAFVFKGGVFNDISRLADIENYFDKNKIHYVSEPLQKKYKLSNAVEQRSYSINGVKVFVYSLPSLAETQEADLKLVNNTLKDLSYTVATAEKFIFAYNSDDPNLEDMYSDLYTLIDKIKK